MKYKQLILIILVMICILTGCIFIYDPPSKVDQRLKIHNTSDETIYYLITSAAKLNSNQRIVYDFQTHNYISNEKKTITDTVFYEYKLLPRTLDTVKYFKKYEDVIKDSSDKKLHLYFFKEKTIQTIPWTEILSSKLYDLKSFEISDLETMNWIVKYPMS